MQNKKIILLAGKGCSTDIVFNSLNSRFGVHKVILENKEPLGVFIKRRIKKLGAVSVSGQILFQLCIVKVLDAVSKSRKAEILAGNKLNASEIPAKVKCQVISVNSDETIQILKEEAPDLIIVNGTRIISKSVLESVNCKFINMHAGITPRYRGVHGMYWALTKGDIENSGVTVHFVDAGIDTGSIIYQANVLPGKRDNFVTYPLLQLAAGINLMQEAIQDYFDGKVQTRAGTPDSSLWYHPTIWQYLYYRIAKRIR